MNKLTLLEHVKLDAPVEVEVYEIDDCFVVGLDPSALDDLDQPHLWNPYTGEKMEIPSKKVVVRG